MLYINKDVMVEKIVKATYPDYNGKKFKLEVTNRPINCKSYWSGGSRDYFTFLKIDTMQAITMPSQSAYDKQIDGLESVTLSENVICVEHTISRGYDAGITIYVHPCNAAALLPKPQDNNLTNDETIVLAATRQYKSSYGGVSNYRFVEAQKDTGITLDRYNAAKASLVVKGLLDSRGAITIEGRNCPESKKHLYELRPKKEISVTV